MNRTCTLGEVVSLAALCCLSACGPGWENTPLYTAPRSMGGGCGNCTSGGGAGGGAGVGFCGGAAEDDAPVRAGAQPPPLIGGTMVALANGGFVIADPDRALLWLVSANLGSVRQVALLPGDEPGRVVESGGHAYVVLRRADQLAELDVAAGTVRRLETCHLPRGLAARAGQLVVACLSGELETLDPATGTRTPLPTSVPLSDLRDVVVDGDALVVTELRSGSVRSIAADGSVTMLSTPVIPGFEPHVAWRAVGRPSGGALVVRQQHRATTLPPAAGCASYGESADTGVGSGGGSGGVVRAEALSISGMTAVVTALTGNFPAVVLPVDLAVSPSGRVAILSAGTGSMVLLSLGARRDVRQRADLLEYLKTR